MCSTWWAAHPWSTCPASPAITGICGTVADARTDLLGTIAEVREVLEPAGLAMQAGGLHPSAQWQDLVVSDKPRYQEFAEWIQWPARRSMCHGIHYHVGIRSGDAAIAIANSLAVWTPLLLGPSAASPFWGGRDTGMASARTKVFEGMPTADLPPELDDYADFAELMRTMQDAGAIRSVRELWWDVRPHPGFGTVEIRVCDSMGTLEEVLALAAFSQCLVSDLNDRFDGGEPLPRLPRWALKENKWRAARWGVDTTVIEPSLKTVPLREALGAEVERLAPTAQRLGCADELLAVPALAAEPGYVRQRRIAEQTGSLTAVTEDLVLRWPSGG
jgi:carboxylate-amine ligase